MNKLSDVVTELPWNKKLVILRIAKGLSSEEMAREYGINRKNYWEWEKGKVTPSNPSKKLICKIHNIDEEELWGKKGKRIKGNTKMQIL